MAQLIYLPDVVTLELDAERCVGCGMCTQVCPHGVFAPCGAKVQIIARDACMECGACARNCPVGAIEVRSGVGCAAAILIGNPLGPDADCGCPGCRT